MKKISADANLSRRRYLAKSPLLLTPLALAACGSSASDLLIKQNEFFEGSRGNDLIGPFDTSVWFRGNGGNDQIYGSPENDIIHLGSDASIAETYAGDDVISFSSWGNQVDTGAGVDTLKIELSTTSNVIVDVPNEIMYRENLLSSFNNEISNFEIIDASLSASNLFITSTSEMVTIKTGIGNDSVSVSDHSADLDGGDGEDTLTFTKNSLRDSTEINLADETYQSNSGQDTQTITNFENVQIIGTNEAVLIGDQNENQLSGGGGSDTIIGGGGSDTLIGGAGRDFFRFNSTDAPNEPDTIEDFDAGSAGDVLQFNFENSLSSTGLSFRTLDLTSGTTKTLGTNTDILLLVGSSYVSEGQLLATLNGSSGLQEHRGQFQNSKQVCLWEHSPSNSLKVSIVSDAIGDGLFADEINTIVKLSGLGRDDFSSIGVSNFDIT
jgi:Ca2+-binding RTX toxin-like protein